MAYPFLRLCATERRNGYAGRIRLYISPAETGTPSVRAHTHSRVRNPGTPPHWPSPAHTLTQVIRALQGDSLVSPVRRRNGYALPPPSPRMPVSRCPKAGICSNMLPGSTQKWVRTGDAATSETHGQTTQKRVHLQILGTNRQAPLRLWTSLWKQQVIPAESGSARSQNWVRICADSGSQQRRIRYGSLQKWVRKTAIRPAKSWACRSRIRFTSS